MGDTTENVETVNQETTSNNATNNSTPAPSQSNAVDTAEVERLRKEAEAATKRANQLQNQLSAKEKAEEEAQQKRLEEQNEWKQVAEQEKAKREALENERQEAEAKEAKRLAEETIFAEFSEEAIEVAKDAGLSLKDDSDEAKADFKQRMEKISQKVATSAKVTPNNPGGTEQPNDRAEKVQRMRNGDKQARDEVINTLPVLDVMRKQAGYSPQE